MGLIDALIRVFSGDPDESGQDDSPGSGGELGRPNDPQHTGGGSGPKEGGHGSHWDTVVRGDGEIQETIMETVEEGEPTEGIDHVGYVSGGDVRSLVVADPSGTITTGYPLGDGIDHEFVVEDRVVWANGHEAQFTGELGPAEVSFFPTNFYALSDDVGGTQQVSLGAFAYALGPVEETTVTGEGDETYDTAGMAALLPMDGGDIDDYAVQTTVKEATECEFRERTIYQLRVPLFRGEDGETDFDVYLYVGEHVLDGYVPAVGDDVAGAIWLQGHVET